MSCKAHLKYTKKNMYKLHKKNKIYKIVIVRYKLIQFKLTISKFKQTSLPKLIFLHRIHSMKNVKKYQDLTVRDKYGLMSQIKHIIQD